MSEIKINSTPKKRGGWLRKLAWFAGIVVVLLIVIYFVATSTAFLKGVILPQVSKALDADVTVANAQISPFSHVMVDGLKVQPHGGEPLLTVQEIRASYSLWAIIGGKINVSEVAVESPVITVIQNADGTSNLDPFTKKTVPTTKPAHTAKAASSTKPLQVNIAKIALNNAMVRLVKHYSNGGQDVTEVSGLNCTVTNVKNGESGKIALAAVLAVQKAAQTNAAAGALQAKLNGSFDFALTPDLKPASVQGNLNFAVGSATGPLAELNAFAATLDCQLTATELKQLELRFTRADAVLADIRASGPFDAEKTEGKIRLVVSGIDKQALNLVGAASGMDFGTTTISSTNDIELSRGGSLITAVGRLDLAHLQITKQGQASPTLDLHCDYDVTVDQTAASAVLKSLNLTGTQNSQPLLQGGLTSPMTIAWGSASNSVGDAAFNFSIPNLKFADWKAFTGENGPEGVVTVKATLTSKQAGKQLAFALDTHVNDLTTGTGSARVNQGSVQLQANGSATDLKLFKLDTYQLDLTRQGRSVLKVSGNATFDSATQDADLRVNVQTALTRLLGKPDSDATNDAINLSAHVTNKQNKITLAGQLALSPTARATNDLDIDGNVDLTLAGAITGNFKLTAAALDVTSYYDLFTAAKPGATNVAPAKTTATTSANPDEEPAAVKLPLKNFVLDLNIGHLFLREVDIANWQTTVLLDGGHVLVKPCQLTLNDAPVKATVDLDLGVPGYTYDVAFNANAIPLTPLVDSFAPDRKGQIAGTTSANAQIKGAGITGTNLQKNLAAQFDFATTNMNLSVANVRSPVINGIINVIIGIPDLIKNPAAAIGGWFGGSHNSGWADQLTASPIDTIALNAVAGGGQVQLTQAEVRSSAFQVIATGNIILQPVLTNSTMLIPVQILLSRSLGDQIGLVNSDTPTNAQYVPMPEFLKMSGTVGNPKTDLDKRALLLIAAKAGGGIGKNIGGVAGQESKSVFNAVEGLLGTKSTTNTNSAATTNAAPAGGLLNLFKKLK
jgi:hypothetical protein